MRRRRLIILLKLEVCSGPTASIGNPVNFAEDPSSAVRCSSDLLGLSESQEREIRETRRFVAATLCHGLPTNPQLLSSRPVEAPPVCCLYRCLNKASVGSAC